MRYCSILRQGARHERRLLRLRDVHQGARARGPPAGDTRGRDPARTRRRGIQRAHLLRVLLPRRRVCPPSGCHSQSRRRRAQDQEVLHRRPGRPRLVLSAVPGQRGHVPAGADRPNRLRHGGLPRRVPRGEAGGRRKRAQDSRDTGQRGIRGRRAEVRGEGGPPGDEGARELEPPVQVPEEAGQGRDVRAARRRGPRSRARRSARAGCGPRAAEHPGRRHRERVRGLGQLRDGGD
mmetsp:Transcript_14453/g.61068  ORF Transcript_14453/g.61068 Transcript_14453/m.61068 type:complete len:235 (-) Transcript_14453:334-1038(-)